MASQGAQVGSAKAGARFSSGEQGGDFPILCETCLGPNQYVRMIRNKFDKQCHVCERPMTTFRWKPGTDSRYKSTVICQTCAKTKHVCQCCILDMEYALPTAVRDHYTGGDGVVAQKSDVMREYTAQQREVALAGGQLTAYQSGESRQRANPQLAKLARVQPRYERNRAHICSFFVKGQCLRGKACPYRHEMPQGGEMADQRIRDRYFGSADPVAEKILRTQREREAAAAEKQKQREAEAAARKAAAEEAAAQPRPLPGVPGGALPAYPSMKQNWLGEQ